MRWACSLVGVDWLAIRIIIRQSLFAAPALEWTLLATALALRERGEALPGALIAGSPPTDLAMTGETIKTKALVDPLMGGGLAQDAFALYTNHGATDPRNPLVSPLYAHVQGLPPTLLLVGTEEALLSDSIRMADRLKAAGVEVKLEIWPGLWHDFVGSPEVIPEVGVCGW